MKHEIQVVKASKSVTYQASALKQYDQWNQFTHTPIQLWQKKDKGTVWKTTN